MSTKKSDENLFLTLDNNILEKGGYPVEFKTSRLLGIYRVT